MPDISPAEPALVFEDTRDAPIIYFEAAPGLAMIGGVMTLTLTTRIQVRISGSQVDTRDVIVAHLRCNTTAALNLKSAIDQAMLIGMPITGDGEAN